MKVLVIGCGSAGERHIKNLKSLGINVFCYDRDVDRMKKMVDEYACQIYDFNSFHIQMDAWVIAPPPSYHIPFALEAIKHGSNVFIEKPLSHNLSQVDEVISTAKEKGFIIQVGYQFRFNSALNHVKNLIENNTIGRVMSIRAEVGQDLRQWHPQEDYHKLYTCYEELGGGILLDASHEIEYVMRLANSSVKLVSCFCDKLSDLDMDCEDTAEINLKFENNVIANIHLDCTQKAYSRWCKVIGTQGALMWIYPDKVFLDGFDWLPTPLPSPCDMYLEEMKHFISCIQDKKTPIVDGLQGEYVLKVVLAAKESNKKGGVVNL